LREQRVGEVRADESAAAGDEDVFGQGGFYTRTGSARPAASRSASARSVRSHVKSRSSRPKCPYAAVFA
jgi:hypothetical protein